jgi:pimeloyl-ACP methyl ester carboxylesterase
MSNMPEVLWLNTSPSLQYFDRILLRYLCCQGSTGEWNYCQNQDEPSSLDIALVLLHDYLKSHDKPIHLIGHSTGGLLGLLYARKYPERVKSLTLLAVGVHPAVDWQAHYYVQRKLLPCSRHCILTQMARNLFGFQDRYTTNFLVKVLEKDLENSPSPHSLFQRVSIPESGVPVPMLVCGGKDDIIVDSRELQGWQPWLKESDRIWECPQGSHFFHYFHSTLVGRQVVKFWNSLPAQSLMPLQR